MASDSKKLKGKISEAIAVATGDRDHEAKAYVERRTGHEPSKTEAERAKKIVKAKHHDYGDRTPPSASRTTSGSRR